MEILHEDLLNVIREKCSSGWELSVFGDHIIVNVVEKQSEFRLVYSSIKQEITQCVKANFPERGIDILFEVRIGSWNCSFKIGKTMRES